MSKFDQILPDEVLLLIVEHVDDSPTLFALLTTCKTVFKHAVRKLWTDPFSRVRFRSSDDNLDSIVSCIIAISPSRHPSVERLREYYEDLSPSSQAPFVDYLAMIRHAHILHDDVYEHSNEYFITLAEALPWMVCDGRFEQLHTMYIVSAKAEEYLEHIPKMTRLTEVSWVQDRTPMVREIPKIRRFVEAFVAEHGDRGRELEMRFIPYDGGVFSSMLMDLEVALVDVFRLLAPFPPSKRSIDGIYELVRCLAHKDTTDFRHIQEVTTDGREGLADILSRCTALESLTMYSVVDAAMHLGALAGPQPRGFYWYNLDEIYRPMPAPAPALSLPPLKHVILTIRTSEFGWIMNGLVNQFGMTLESLELQLTGSCPMPFGDYGRENFLPLGHAKAVKLHTDQWNLPRLRRLSLEFFGQGNICFFVDGDMSGMPKLETLVIRESRLDRFPDLDLKTEDDELKSDVRRSNSRVWRLPELRELELFHLVACRFHPGSLVLSPKLTTLHLDMDTRFQRLRSAWDIQSLWLSVAESWSGPQLTQLKHLTLSDHAFLCLDLYTTARLMPALEVLVYSFGWPRDNICFEPRLSDVLLGERNAWNLEDKRMAASKALASICLPNLRSLELAGDMIAYAQDFDNLLQKDLLPQLQSLKIGSLNCGETGSLLSSANKHPSLRRVKVQHLGM